MKIAVVVLLVCIGFSQAFDGWGLFKKWKGEVEEALDSNKKNEHAERFLKEVHDKGVELVEGHADIKNRIHKVWNKVQKHLPEEPEVPTTEPFEPEIKPTEPEPILTESPEPSEPPYEKIVEPSMEIYQNLTENSLEPINESYEEVHEGHIDLIKSDGGFEEGHEENESWEEEPTEKHEEPTEGYVEPTEGYVEPTEGYVEPTEVTPEVQPEKPTEEFIVEPVEEPEGEDHDYNEHNYHVDSDENAAKGEEIVSVVEKPNQEKMFSVDQIEVAPKESFGVFLEPVAFKWLEKRQHKLRKLWKKFTSKHSEKVLNKIRKLEKQMAMKREE